jgi:sarcosine oxidase delta subunit
MSSTTCPNCGADLAVSGSVRISEYHFGRLEAAKQELAEGPGYVYHREAPDVYTIHCNGCKRLVATLPLHK